MATFDDPLGPIRGIAILWACSVVLLAWLIVRVARQARRGLGRLRSLAGEDGFAYSLSFAMSTPFLMLVVAVVVETTLLLMAHVGTFYAAYAAARSAIVWDTADVPAIVREERVWLAAVHAIAPFASSDPAHLEPRLARLAETGITYHYVGKYKAYCPGGPLGNAYLVRKLFYSHQALKLGRTPPARWDASTTATVTFEHAFHWAIVGRALGHRAPWGGSTYTYTLGSSVTLQNEGARNPSQTLGIRYDSDY